MIKAGLADGPTGTGKGTVLAAALSYLSAGLSVIPIRADGSKAPQADLLPGGKWKQFQESGPTDPQLRGWFTRPETPGIGIVWGSVSGNGEALDFDAPGLYEEFEPLCGEQGLGDLIASMPLVETPSGGRHLLYRCEEAVAGNQKLAERLVEAPEGAKGARLVGDRRYTVETLIETRGEAGYTLAPGSPAACHPDGRPYRFLRGRPHSLPTITSQQRETLLTLAGTFNQHVEPSRVVDAPKITSATRDRGNETLGLRPGDDYNLRGDLDPVLLQGGWRQTGQAGEKGLWQRPGKTGAGISATSNYGGSGLLYVWSSNAAPFEPQRAYTRFAVYALLEHGGNYADAARELAAQGYGDPPKTKPVVRSRTTGAQSDMKAEDESGVTVPEVAWPVGDPAMFYGLAGDIVKVIEPHTEADPVALLVQFLAAFGSALGRKAHFTAEADKHFGNLFAVIVGISSKGRKGTSWGHIRRLFEKADPPWASACVQTGLSSGEGLIWHVRDGVEREEKNKKTGETETVTVDAGVEDKRLLAMASEFASVLRVASRDGNTLSAILRDAWDKGRLQTMTKNSAATATGAHVSLVGHVTADELRRELSSTEAGNGFANRFLWVCVKRSKELPEGGNLSEAALSPFVSRLQAALGSAGQTEELKRDEGARAVWLAVYHDLSEGGPGLSGAVTSRAEAQVMRLALLYALLDGDDAIRRPHMVAALALWEYVEASAKYVFGDSMGDAVADDILRALRNAPDGKTRNDLRDLFGRNQSSNRIGQALESLLRHKRIRMEKQETDGRPAERWFAVTDGNAGQQ